MAEKSELQRILRLFQDVGHTDDAVESGIKCYRKPNRTEVRTFSAQDAARITCYAVKGGATKAEIDRRFKIVCKAEDDQRRDRAQVAEEAIASAIEAIELNTQQLLDEWRAFLIVNGILLGLIALLGVLRLAGPLRLVATPLRTGARVAQVQVAQLITLNITRRAANDAFINQVREALRLAA